MIKRDEIRTMPACRKMDELMEVYVVGGEVAPRGFHQTEYSQDVNEAIKALEKHHKFLIESMKAGYVVKTWANHYSGAMTGEGETLPLAACRSMLLWEADR